MVSAITHSLLAFPRSAPAATLSTGNPKPAGRVGHCGSV